MRNLVGVSISCSGMNTRSWLRPIIFKRSLNASRTTDSRCARNLLQIPKFVEIFGYRQLTHGVSAGPSCNPYLKNHGEYAINARRGLPMNCGRNALELRSLSRWRTALHAYLPPARIEELSEYRNSC